MDDRIETENPNFQLGMEERPKDAIPELEHTGERFLPGTAGSAEIAYDHIARYRFAARFVKDKETIDLGCGTGYGTYSLSKSARGILGVDLSSEAVTYADWSYGTPGLRYEVGDVTELPYPEGSFEAAVSFEVIEHLERPESLVKEARRLLKADGVFVLSTPDKQTYSNARNFVNPHHLKEMYPLEFREVLERHFRHVQIYRQGALAGSVITADSDELLEDERATLESTRFSLPDPEFGREVPTSLYMIAVCTNAPAPEPLQSPYLVLDRDRQIYDDQLDWHETSRKVMTCYVHQYNLLKEELQLRKHELRQASNSLQAMQNSRSWKLATKLSSVVNLIRRVPGRSG